MKKEIKEKLPSWYKDLDFTYSIIGSDDIDYLASNYVLKELFSCDTDLFFDFRTMYIKEDIDINNLERDRIIGVDLDLSKNKCFSNHVTYVKNPDTISLNRNISYLTRNSYFKKFAGSTLLTIMSLYDIDISNMTEQQLEILICVDTAFKQYYFNKDLFTYYYNDVLEYPVFTDIVAKHKDKQYFYDIIKKYRLYGKIKVNNDGYLETNIDLKSLSDIFNIDLSLSKDRFIPIYNMQSTGLNIYQLRCEVKNEDDIFSSAVTNFNFVKASVKF